MKLLINPEYKALIPPLSDEEYEELEQNLIERGCRDAIVVWRSKGKPETKNNITMDTFTDTIIDGHNRYEICQMHDIHFKVHPMWFDSEDEVKAWIIKNQFARRNLDKVQRSRLALTLKKMIAGKAKENQIKSGIGYGKGSQKSVEPIQAMDTQKELAKIAGVSHDTIHKVATVDNTAPEPIKQAMADNVVSINRAYEATKAINSLPEQEQNVKKEQLSAIYNLPQEEYAAAVAKVIKDLSPQDQNIAINDFVNNDPEILSDEEQMKKEKYFNGVILRAMQLSPDDGYLDAWLSDKDRSGMEEQLETLEMAIKNLQEIYSKAAKMVNDNTRLRRA